MVVSCKTYRRQYTIQYTQNIVIVILYGEFLATILLLFNHNFMHKDDYFKRYEIKS